MAKKEDAQRIIYQIDTSPFAAAVQDALFSTNVKSTLDIYAKSTTFPTPTPKIEDILAKWNTYEALRLRCATDDRSSKAVTQRKDARFLLQLDMLRLCWYTQLNGDNNPAKMGGDTGMKMEGDRAATPEYVKPIDVRVLSNGIDAATDTYSIKAVIPPQKNSRGAIYQLHRKGQAEPEAERPFLGNRPRVITGFSRGEEGMIRVYLIGGGGAGKSPWSDWMPYIAV